jgi:hypothetical protein
VAQQPAMRGFDDSFRVQELIFLGAIGFDHKNNSIH